MQLDGPKWESAWVLIDLPTKDDASDYAKRLALKRDKSGEKYPQWIVNGIRY